ncbi:CDP-alcohol phosphatidyltransferase family protein [Clostridium sp. Mt-5]|uniref:Phosphatidylglycerophosphate synthase n=1 Tax=Clostridium moutaii TaxID=3240932 RepID=A0ABV4BU91_9CLOT
MLKIILINTITLLRIPLSVTFCAILFSDNYKITLGSILFAIIAMTDFFDGKMARKFKAQTKLGAVFDVVSDFFFIITTSCSLYFQGLFPFGMLVIIILKFLEFWITSFLSASNEKNEKVFIFDTIGRAVAISFYLLPMIILIFQVLLSNGQLRVVTTTIYIVITTFAFISSLLRILMKRIKTESH